MSLLGRNRQLAALYLDGVVAPRQRNQSGGIMMRNYIYYIPITAPRALMDADCCKTESQSHVARTKRTSQITWAFGVSPTLVDVNC